MGFMKGKKAIPLMLITAILITVGSQSIEAIQGNRFTAKENINRTISTSQNITKEQAKEKTIELFEKYFDEKIDTKNLFENTKLFKVEDECNFEGKDHWLISWSTFDLSRLGNTEGMTDDEIKQLNEDLHNATSYDALIEEKTGEIIEIGKIDGKRDGNLTIEELKEKEIETEDAKNIALNYIKKNKLVDNIEGLEFLGEIRITPELCCIAYRYDKNKVIEVHVESLSRKVSGFRYEDEQEARDSIEINKNYKTDGGIG